MIENATDTNNNMVSSSSSSIIPNKEDVWCCTGSIAAEGSSESIDIQRIAGYESTVMHGLIGNQECDLLSSPSVQNLDLAKASDWMEVIEIAEHRQNQLGGAGAYDTFRCDLKLSDKSWNIWGQNFHLERLQNSYRSLLKDCRPEAENEERIQHAMEQSHRMVDILLHEAESALWKSTNNGLQSDGVHDDVAIQLVRMTLLWSHGRISSTRNRSGGVGWEDENAIVVRGHACASMNRNRTHYIHCPVKPIVCSVAAEGHHHSSTITVDNSLPSRFQDNPQFKVASWTKLRKKFENPGTFKPPGVAEVLMVRAAPNDTGPELLEGLSSNFFVVYNDGTLRTPVQGVLHGYVRHLVLECAEACGLKIDDSPILLQESPRWKEAFITSSSRLIFPISKILMHDFDDEDNYNTNATCTIGPTFREIWTDPVLSKTQATTPSRSYPIQPKWQELLNEILTRGGYPPPR
jgi:branched-subunit amino acid aminotransferase/4-amino-4-deoxychorismate lyase